MDAAILTSGLAAVVGKPSKPYSKRIALGLCFECRGSRMVRLRLSLPKLSADLLDLQLSITLSQEIQLSRRLTQEVSITIIVLTSVLYPVVGIDVSSFTVDFDSSNLETGQTYTFRVQANDKNGQQAGNNEVLVLYHDGVEYTLLSEGDGWYGTDQL